VPSSSERGKRSMNTVRNSLMYGKYSRCAGDTCRIFSMPAGAWPSGKGASTSPWSLTRRIFQGVDAADRSDHCVFVLVAATRNT